MMSSSRIRKSMEDQEVQTNARRKRPRTSLAKKKKPQKTYHKNDDYHGDPELINGRRFVIYSKD